MEALDKSLGHTISSQARWPASWNELKDRYPEKATFVLTICRITIAWYERLRWRLDTDHFPDWTEEFRLMLLVQGEESNCTLRFVLLICERTLFLFLSLGVFDLLARNNLGS